MDQDATWYGGRPRPCNIVLDGDPAAPPKGTQQPLPQFSAHVKACCAGVWILRRIVNYRHTQIRIAVYGRTVYDPCLMGAL